MNYYERHLGDYSKNAMHLSLLEHGVYVRLIDVYYTKECPIPDDKAARWIGAETQAETQALQVVLEEFFVRDGNLWRQPRCDAEIAEYVSGEPEREAKKVNETTRLQRHREERSKLFKALNDAGLHADWNIKIGELRRRVAEVEAGKTETHSSSFHETATATLATATHSPLPTTHTEKKKDKSPTVPTLTADELIADGLQPETANAWLAHRRSKKAKLTALAWKGFKAEAKKARWSLEAAVLKAIARNWIGFEAAWVSGETPTFKQRDTADAIARVHEMTGGLVSAKPVTRNNDALQEAFDATPRLVG